MRGWKWWWWWVLPLPTSADWGGRENGDEMSVVLIKNILDEIIKMENYHFFRSSVRMFEFSIFLFLISSHFSVFFRLPCTAMNSTILIPLVIHYLINRNEKKEKSSEDIWVETDDGTTNWIHLHNNNFELLKETRENFESSANWRIRCPMRMDI